MTHSNNWAGAMNTEKTNKSNWGRKKRFKAKDFSCEHVKPVKLVGYINGKEKYGLEVCTCKNKYRGERKNFRLHSLWLADLREKTP